MKEMIKRKSTMDGRGIMTRMTVGGGLSTGGSWHTLNTLVWERWLDSSQPLFKENGSDGSSAMGGRVLACERPN